MKKSYRAKVVYLAAECKYVKAVCRKWSKLVAGAMLPCMFVQLFKLLSAEGVRQLASRNGRKINTIILHLKKKA